jgi:Mn-dependent DtxR family transcriptional regulator
LVDSGASTEHEILHSIELLTRRAGKATTQAIASDIFLSAVQTWRYLKRLEDEGQVQRIGERGGWKRAA